MLFDLRGQISLLIWHFVIIIKSTRWSANLSPSHSNFSFGIICGRLWGSLSIEVHLGSISFSALTSFEKQCHKGLTKVVQPKKVASRIEQISTQPHSLLAWQIGMCWMLQRMGKLLRNMSAAMSRSEWFLGTGERTLSGFDIWSILAYAIVNSFHRNNLTFVFWPFSSAPGQSNSCTYWIAIHAEYEQACAPKTVSARYEVLFTSVFFTDVSTERKSSIFDHLRPHPDF